MASKRAFHIPELFIMIMLAMDETLQLFVDRRVCRHWTMCIAASQPLQTYMFLSPSAIAIIPTDIRLNPCVAKVLHLAKLQHKADVMSRDYRAFAAAGPGSKTSTKWATPAAAWRKTLLFSSPLRDHHLVTHVHDSQGKLFLDSLAGDGRYGPLTMDGLWKAVERLVKRKPKDVAMFRLYGSVNEGRVLKLDELERFSLACVKRHLAPENLAPVVLEEVSVKGR